MPKYQVIQYYTVSKVFEVDAIDEQAASDKVSEDTNLKPIMVTGEEFSDEIIEELDS